MHPHGISDLPTVPAGNRHAHRQPDFATGPQHVFVTLCESLECQPEPAQPIAFVRIRAGEVHHQIRACVAQHFRQRPRQSRQILVVSHTVSQFLVAAPIHFVERKVLRAMHVERVHRIVVRKHGVCTVSLMHIEVHDTRATDLALRLQSTDGDRHIVEHAEPFAAIGKRVMCATGEVHRDAVLRRVCARLDRPADHAKCPLHERRAPRQPDTALMSGIKRSIFHAIHVFRRMDAMQVRV